MQSETAMVYKAAPPLLATLADAGVALATATDTVKFCELLHNIFQPPIKTLSMTELKEMCEILTELFELLA